eukprot:scaffold146405_cov92-Attheya_sp.AAC.2
MTKATQSIEWYDTSREFLSKSFHMPPIYPRIYWGQTVGSATTGPIHFAMAHLVSTITTYLPFGACEIIPLREATDGSL